MSAMLREQDRRAIDLLLDRGHSATAAGPTGTDVLNPSDGMSAAAFSPHASPIDPERLQGVQGVLSLLSLLPDEEPPAGLLERTLERIERSGARAGEHVPFRSPGLTADPSLPPA